MHLENKIEKFNHLAKNLLIIKFINRYEKNIFSFLTFYFVVKKKLSATRQRCNNPKLE